MIFNAYSESSDGLFGVSVKSAGHIFAENGRRVSRPTGREDWLLFYVAKGTERFTLDGETDAPEGSFIIFKPHQKQEHILFMLVVGLYCRQNNWVVNFMFFHSHHFTCISIH